MTLRLYVFCLLYSNVVFAFGSHVNGKRNAFRGAAVTSSIPPS